uniref:Uncharacterized protein n=1 Tax=Sus scrofa TaxID=9823 RepID=A0A8D1RRG2_PIG
MLAPLLASAGHTTCNVESWGDSGAARAQPSTTSPAPPCQEELAASQLASLCAELAAVLGSQDDLRALLAKALSQGEVRAALNQALSKEVLGATVAKALPQGILGTALVKALSWGELGTTLSRALSRGELRAELTKVIQGRLADVLSKALTEEERATLSQALCQGELGAVLSQSLSQAALRSGVVLPKAASKTAGSGMTVMPSPVEVDYRGNQLASWGPSLGPMRLQPNKVRVPWGGAWEGFVTGWPSGFLEERGDGAMLVGSPCSSVVSVGTSLTAGVITAIHQYPLIAALDPTLSWETGPSSDSLNLYLSPEVFENVYLHPRASELTSDLHPMLGDMDPNLSNSPHLQPPPGLWQPLIANGVGPSTSQPSLAGGSTTPSSHSPHEVSRVAPRPWASSREGRVASGKLPNTKGGGRAAHSHQCAAAYGGSTCWCQPSGVSRVPPGVRRPSATKGLQQPSVVPEETMQRTRSPNRKRPSMGTRDVTSKVTPSPPHATMVSRPQAQIPKACVITPGSVAPGHRWALRTQANPTLFQASPGNKLAPTLPRTAIPRQEKSRKGDAVSSVPSPQKLVTSHIINELVATLPQAPDNDLARSFSQDSTDYGPNMSNSQSSLRSCSSRSLSTMSMASLTALDLVEEESWEASLDRDLHLGALQSGEAMEGSQGPGTMGGTESTDHRAMIPKVHDRSSPALEQTPILHRSSVASRLTLSVHWGSDDQDEGDMFSGQSSMDLEESLSQKPRRTGLTRSLSLSNVVPTVYWQLPMPGRLTPYLSQPTVASKVSPNRGQPFMAIRDTSSLFELSAANKMTPSLWQTSRTDSMGLCLSQPSRVSGVTLSLTQPSVTGGMAPSLAQASMIVGGAPNLAQPLVTGEGVPSLVQPLMTGGVAPSLIQPLMTGGVAHSLAQPPLASRGVPSLAQASMTGRLATSQAQTLMTSAVQPPVTGGVIPGLAQSPVTCWVPSSLAQSSMTSGLYPSLAQASMFSGGAPYLAQPSVTGEGAPSLAQPLVTGEGDPSLAQPLVTGEGDPSLAQPLVTGEGDPSLAQPSMTGGVDPSLSQPSMTGGVVPSLAQPSMTSEVAPSLAQPPVTGGVAPSLAQSPVTSDGVPSLAQPSVTGGVAPNLAQPSMTGGVSPSLAQPSMPGEVAPSLAQPPVTSEMAPSLAQPSVTGGVAPSLAKPPVTSGGAPSLAQPSVTGGVAPSLTQPSMTGEGAPSLAQPSMTGGVSPSLAQPSMTGGITPSLDQPPVTSGVPPSLEQSSMTSEVYPSLAQAPMFSGGAPYLAQPSVANRVASNLAQSLATHGVAPSLAQASMTGGVYPSLNQSSRVGGVAPCLAKLPMTSRVTSSLAQPCMTSRVAPSLGQTSVAGDVLPSMVQPSKIDGMTCSLAHPPVTGGVGLSIGQTSRVGGAAPSLAQSSLTTGMTPNLGHPSLIIGVAPCLAQPSFAVGMAPGLGQPSMEYREAPCLGQPSMASGVFSSLTQPSVARRGPPSLAQPSMISGTGCTLGQPSWSSRVGSNLPSSRVNAVAPSLHHSSFAIDVTSCTPYPMVANGRGRGLSQPTVSTKVDPHQDPLMISGVASNPQAPEFSEVSLGFHQPPSVSGRPLNITEQPSVTVATPNRYQASAASREDPGLGQGPGMSQGILFRGMAASMSHGTMAAGMLPNMSQGTLAAGMFLSMSRVPVSPGMTGSMGRRSVATGMNASQSQAARGTTPIISRASVAGAPLTCEPASGKGPGFSWASGPCGLGKTSSKFSLISMGPSTQVKVDLPVPLDYQYPGSMSSYQPTHAVIQEPGMGMASAVVPGSVTSRITAALVPGTVAGGMAPSFSPGSVGRGMGQSLIPGSMMSSVASSLSPGYMVNGVVHTFPPGSVICGVGQGLPPGSAIGGMSQGLPLDPMTNPVAQSLPPGSEASGMARTLPLSSSGTGVSPGPIAASGGGGKRQDFSVGPSVSLTAPNLLPGSVAGGVDPSVPIAPNVVPASTPGGLNQNLPMASAPGSPSTTGYVAQSLPQGSMLIGLTPRPYHGALAGEGPTASFHAPHDTGPAQVHPQALEANGTAKGVAPVPTVLQRASQLSQALGMMPFETIGRQSVKKSEDPDKSLPQGSLTRTESEILEATPWLYHSPLATDIDYSQEFPAEDETLPKGQRPLLEEVAPSQAKTVTSGVASVPSQSPSFAKHPMASGGPPTLQQRSATSWRVPSSHFVAASGVPDVQMESVKGTGAPLAHQQASVPPAAPQRPSVAHITPQKPSAYQKSLVAHIVPQRHSHKMMASTAVSGSPKPAHSDSMASSLHRGSVAGIVTPSTPQRSGSTSMASQVPLHPSLARGVEAGGFQKPVSRGLIQNGHGSLGPRKSYRAMHDIPASEMPSSSEAHTVPPHQEQEDAPRSLQEVPRPSTGAVPAIMPIIRTGEAAHGVAITRLNPGVRRVSLGYESSPDGSRRPLFSHESPLVSQDSLSSRAPLDSHQPSLTPAVLQGPEDAGVSGGQAWNSAIPSVAVGPRNSTIVPGGTWEPARGTVPWEATGGKAAVDPSQPGELVASVQAVEKIIIHAAVIIQACTRGYLVRRTIKVWHQWAIIIQAAWRGYCVRRDLAQLCRAATIIQAAWRGFCVRRSHTQQMLLPAVWAAVGGGGGGARSISDHRCYQSCQPHACSLCQSLSSGLGSPPSVVMLVGSSPRTCHMCGHTLPTRVVQGTGRGAVVQASMPRGCSIQPTSRSPPQPHSQNKAATTIQSSWRGFRVRRQLKQQQVAAKMLQASWRGRCTRASLTTDALLGPAAWDNSRHTQWPGV